ncbi:hypothetical protein EWB00_007248 [Schistosoma japonicum]|uniref:Uncharacterized protein n=1 Tax=Schistosoma japonicum TaxID=6182 RepID=A0A4Z2CVC8_SCHJA|nr:hypothetical protein EWB00_007248 [Schistosoma japonicum]TNN08133.1 hypothetical protein EWB00_007248 [Schistosoma japonicum]
MIEQFNIQTLSCVWSINRCLLQHVEHTPPTSILQPTLSWAFISSHSQVIFLLFTSVSDSRRNLLLGNPLIVWPSGFQTSIPDSRLIISLKCVILNKTIMYA